MGYLFFVFILFLKLSIFHTQKIYSNFEFFDETSIFELEEDGQLILEDDLNNFNGTLKFNGSYFDKIKTENQSLIHFSQNGSLNRNGNVLKMGGSTIGNYSTNLFSRNDLTRAPKQIINMTGGSNLDFLNEKVSDEINVSGKKNLITGQPKFLEKVILKNSETELSLNIQSKLTNNIVMNGGKLILENDLYLNNSVCFEGKGIVDINNYTLSYPVNGLGEKSSSIKFLNANDISLTAYTTLDGEWAFFGENSYSTLNGYGNVLDIGNGGSIQVGPNHTLYLTGVDLKGLGNTGGTIIMDSTSVVKLSSAIIELDGSYTCTNGKFSVVSPNCKFVIRGNDYFALSGVNSILEVNGVILNFETLANAPIYPPPFRVFSGGAINLLNYGTLQSPNLDIFKGVLNLSVPASYGENYITGGVTMTSGTKVRFVNENPTVPKSMILNCLNKKIRYDIAEPGSVILDPGVSLLIKNLTAENLKFETLDLQGTGDLKAKFRFGNNIVFSVGRDLTINTVPLIFEGNASIDGNNFTISLAGGADRINVSDNVTLTIANATLKIDHSEAINLLGNNSKLILKNVFLELGQTGISVDTGSIEIADMVEIFASKKNTETVFVNFTSKGSLKINPKSSLKINPGISVNFNPTAIDQSETLAQQKRRIFFVDESSFLNLNGCYFNASFVGIAFEKGNLTINNNVFFHLDASTSGKELEIASNCQLTVFPAAVIEVDGVIKYSTPI